MAIALTAVPASAQEVDALTTVEISKTVYLPGDVYERIFEANTSSSTTERHIEFTGWNYGIVEKNAITISGLAGRKISKLEIIYPASSCKHKVYRAELGAGTSSLEYVTGPWVLDGRVVTGSDKTQIGTATIYVGFEPCTMDIYFDVDWSKVADDSITVRAKEYRIVGYTSWGTPIVQWYSEFIGDIYNDKTIVKDTLSLVSISLSQSSGSSPAIPDHASVKVYTSMNSVTFNGSVRDLGGTYWVYLSQESGKKFKFVVKSESGDVLYSTPEPEHSLAAEVAEFPRYVEIYYNDTQVGVITVEEIPEEQPEQPGDYGNPDSKYICILDKYTAKVNEPIIVKVKNTQKAWWNPLDPEWIEGAEIYVDGQSTGVKTKDPDDWGFFDFFDDLVNPDVPQAVIRVDSAGEHYVYAKIGDELSRATNVTILNETYDVNGGADDGDYPRTEPDEDGCQYTLIYSPQSVKVGGKVTFKTVKVCNGVQKEAVRSVILVDGERIGDADPELTYPFNNVGLHEVYAEITTSSGVLRTGTGTVYVYSDVDEFDKDGGSLTLTVRVLDEHSEKSIPGVVVSLLKGGSVVEQKVTREDGTAVLTVDSGVSYTIHVSDPSGDYSNKLIEDRQFSADTELTVYLKPSGDLDDDGGEDLTTTRIELRIDGSDADGQVVWVGKRKISVVNEHGAELADVPIYLNGEMIGETRGWFFGAWLDYDFVDPGNYTLRAEYNGLTDIAYIEVVDPNSYLLSWKLVKVPEQSSENTMGSTGLGAGIGAVIGAILGGGIGAIPGAAIGAGMGYGLYWAWDSIDEWFKSWQFGDVALPVGSEVEFAILQNGKVVAEGGELYINGNKTATFVKDPARYTFDEAGVYNVTAVSATGETVENEITVKVGTTTGFGGFLGQLATAYPILGNQAIDSILWAFILLIGGLIVVSLVLTLIRVVL